MFRLLGYPESSLVKSIQFKCKLSNVCLYFHSVYFVLCIIESEIRRVSRWETEAVEAAAAHNVATLHTHTSYLSFFLHEENFWRIKFTPKKRANYGKIHSKMPIFCVITAKYTVNCQFFALNL